MKGSMDSADYAAGVTYKEEKDGVMEEWVNQIIQWNIQSIFKCFTDGQVENFGHVADNREDDEAGEEGGEAVDQGDNQGVTQAVVLKPGRGHV